MGTLAHTLNMTQQLLDSGNLVRCALKNVTQHSDFPEIAALVERASRPHRRKLLDIIGRRWMRDPRLKNRAFVFAFDGQPTYLECSSLASGSAATSLDGVSVDDDD